MTYTLTNPPTLLQFLGPQGSGKGTQLTLLRTMLRPELPVVTMGDLLRAEKASGSELGQRVAALIDQGKLVTIDLWQEVLTKHLATIDRSTGILLDGVVRTAEQKTAFDSIRTELALPDFTIINLTVPEDESVKRLLLRGRHDDTEDAIRQRLRWSADETAPVIEEYRQRGQVIDINGYQPIETVQAEITDKLLDAGLIKVSDVQ